MRGLRKRLFSCLWAPYASAVKASELYRIEKNLHSLMKVDGPGQDNIPGIFVFCNTHRGWEFQFDCLCNFFCNTTAVKSFRVDVLNRCSGVHEQEITVGGGELRPVGY